MGKHDGGTRLRDHRKSKRAKQRKSGTPFTAQPNAEARTVVQWMRDCGASAGEIMQRTGLTHDFVYRWIARSTTEIAEGRGAKSLVTEKEGQRLKRAVLKVRFASASRLAPSVQNPKTGKHVTKATIASALTKAGLINVRVRKGQLLTDKQRARRLEWCQERLKEKTDFSRWVFSDEKWWCVGGVQGNERMWVLEGDPFPHERFIPTAANPVKVHIWAAISYDGRSTIHIHDGKVDSKVYCACLNDALLPGLYEKDYLALKKSTKYVFMQDGASCHTAATTYAWLQEHLPEHIHHHAKGEWPASSPDLNPIERLWAILQDRVIEKRAYSYDRLVEVVLDEWWRLEQDTIRKLYDTMTVRCQKCVHADGGRFKV